VPRQPAAHRPGAATRPPPPASAAPLPEPVRLLQVRIPAQHELLDAQRRVLLDPLGDLLMAADQRRPRPTPHEPDPGPQVGMDLQPVPAAAVQREHPLLPLGLAPRQPGLYGLHGLGVEPFEQPVRLGPRLRGRVTRDDMQPDTEPERPPLLGRQPPDPGDLLGDLGRRLAPSEVHVHVLGGDLPRDRRRSPEVHLGHRVGQPRQLRVLDAQMLTGQIDGLAVPQLPYDLQEFAGTAVPVVLVEEVPVGPLLVALAAGDDVEEQPSAGLPLERGRHLRGERR
jgi:hypothetical protein